MFRHLFSSLNKMNTQNVEFFYTWKKSKETEFKNIRAKKHPPLGTFLFWQKIPNMNCNTLVSNKMLRSFERLFLSVTLFQNGNLHIKLLFKIAVSNEQNTNLHKENRAECCKSLWSCLRNMELSVVWWQFQEVNFRIRVTPLVSVGWENFRQFLLPPLINLIAWMWTDKDTPKATPRYMTVYTDPVQD